MSLLAAHHSCCGVDSRGQESQGQEVGQGQERCETLEQRILLSCCWRMNDDYGSLMLSTIAKALDIVISSTITSIIVTTVIAGEVVIVIIVSIGVADHWKISLL